MKYLIVDDEPLAILRLTKMLKKAGITDVITAINGQNAVEKVTKHHPHVVLLDIQMPVLTGIQAAPLIKKISPESKIIFCTAFDEYAIKAFDLDASDYLLKPVTQNRLNQALLKIEANTNEKTYPFQKGNDLISLTLDEIYCFISEDKSTTMHCQLGELIIDDSLVTLETKFNHKLLRINRNALINKDELFGIHRAKSQSFALLKSIEYQPQISRRKLPEIKELLK